LVDPPESMVRRNMLSIHHKNDISVNILAFWFVSARHLIATIIDAVNFTCKSIWPSAVSGYSQNFHRYRPKLSVILGLTLTCLLAINLTMLTISI
jgi:hypothetical protein